MARVDLPALLLWGESDRIVTPAYGAAYAAAFGDAQLEIIPEAGHLPQVEQPGATFALIDTYMRQTSRQTSAATVKAQ
ncbi:alpha/beta hydrolase [Nonomuraea sp. NPDC049158]|uniref:alpha/beta fold hydrolase n=1 Tax=Nonomuraea sp. NPDC049158 TaxID=3155649 RepID=UPI0033C8FBD4